MRKAPRPDVGGVGPKLEKRLIPRQPQSSSKAESPKQAADRSLVAGFYLELFARQRRPGWDCCEIDKFEYKPRDDFSRSIEECYRVISRARCCGRSTVGAEMTRRPEQQFQRAVFAHFRARSAPGVFAFHPANGGYRRPVEAKILQGLGVTSGVPDVIAVKDGRTYALELKAEGGKLTEAQEHVLIKLREAGAMATHAHGLDQAIRVLEGWGLLGGRSS